MTETKKESNLDLKNLIYNSNNKIKREINKSNNVGDFKFDESFEDNVIINELSSNNLIEQINNIEFEDSEDAIKLQNNIVNSIKIDI